jgi:predicted dehydrogenase
MSDKVQVGIIGCGGMGSHHARNLAPLEDAHLRAFADVRPEASQKLRDEVGCDYCTTNPQDLFNDDQIDVVLVCTHHDLHVPLAIQAAEARKDIFVEKPLALTIAACEQIQAAVNGAGVKLMTGFQARFSPFIAKLKETIPQPLVIVGQLVDPRWGDESWANDPIEGGGNILSQGCHLFDAMYWLAGAEPVTIYAEGGNLTHPKIPEITDSVVATIRFANGCVASVINGDFGAPALAGKAFYELFGGTKTATLYGYYGTPAIKFWGVEPADFGMDDLPPEYRNSSAAHGYVDEMKALIDWVGKDIDPVNAAKVEDGLRATTIGEKAIAAIKTGQIQRL